MKSSIEVYYYAALAVVFLLFVFFLWRTLKLLKKKKFWAGCRNSSYLLIVLFVLSSILLLGSNMLTYHRLTHEAPVAQLKVKKLAEQRYQVRVLLLDNCRRSTYELNGDQWQIDARIVKWHGWANLLGLDAAYQLDRITGRYQSISQQRTQPASVYSLETQADYDLWALKKDNQWLPWLDAEYGQSVFLPMQDQQSYLVYMTQTGLLARKRQMDLHKKGFNQIGKCELL